MPPAKDFCVAIVGGGMCGLACAIGLAKRGIHADVFEAAPAFGEVGAGVGLGLNAIRALDGIGILKPVMEKTDTKKPTLRSFVFVSGTGQHEVIYDYAKDSGQFGLGIYRPAFLDALLPLLDPKSLHLNKKCLLVTRLTSGRYRLDFEDGTAHETDLVIGADGIKSTVRNSLVGSTPSKNLVFHNMVVYRGLVPHDSLLKAGVKTEVNGMPLCWMGAGKHIITFPMQGTKMINVVLFSSDSSKPAGPPLEGPWVEDVPRAEIENLYNDWGDDAKIIVDHVKTPSKWSIHAVDPPLKSYVTGKIILVGDSAHAMQPHLGAGVGQGFEDVYALCRLLAHPVTRLSNLELVLQVYDNLRPRRANMILAESARAGRIYDSFGRPGCGVTWVQQQLAGIWEPVWHYDLKKEVDIALERLESNKAFMARL